MANEHVLVDFYWDVLKRTDTLNNLLTDNGMAVTREAYALRGISAYELIRQGVKFRVVPRIKEEDTSKKFSLFGKKEEAQAETDQKEEDVVLKDMEGNEYSIDGALLKSIMNDDYARLVKKEIAIGAKAANIMTISVPDLNDLEEKEKEKEDLSESSSPTEESPKDESRDDPNRLPEFMQDSRYKNDLDGKKAEETFFYNKHDITITYKGETGVIHFYVYPLAIKYNDPASDVLVIAESGGVLRTGISHGVGASIEVEFGEIPFMVRGSFDNGIFKSQVHPLLEEITNTMQEEIYNHPAEPRTSTTYMQLNFKNMTMYLFPAKYGGNNDSGFAPAALAMIRNNHLELLTPTSEGTFAVTGDHGEPISVETYWQGAKNPVFYGEAIED